MVRFMARLTDGCDIPKSSSLLLNIEVLPNILSPDGLITLFLFVGDVIATRTNSTTSLIPHDLIYLSDLEYLGRRYKNLSILAS